MTADKLNPEAKLHGDVVSQISEGLVRLLKEQYGNGPSQTRTIYDDDMVLCVLRGNFTKVEQTLSESGRTDVVDQLRAAFQRAMAPEFKSVVETATGRKVIAFMSGSSIDPDMMGEMFVLEPRSK
ncbi:MAG: DUF2294 domain-containing protein [Solirubrobacterales bacterium]